MRVRANRRAIAKHSRNGDRIVLVPDTVVEHYYHFLLDLALPLYLLIDSVPDNASFVLKTTGPFLDRLRPLFPTQLTIATADQDTTRLPTRSLIGMNPFFVHVTRDELVMFSEHVRKMSGVAPSCPKNKVLLIERLPPQEFFETAAKSKGGGTRRRSIPNHEELSLALQSKVRPPFEFQNVQLERLSFETQVKLFAEAAVVIGQHGAGLANCLWMSPGGTVIELTNNADLSHFQAISRAMGHSHLLHTTGGAHSPVDVASLTDQLERNEQLANVIAR
jgi:hypothetical protein